MENYMQTAHEIIEQLGGRQFIAMTGVNKILADDVNRGRVIFNFKGSARANHCVITLDFSDTYTVEFYKTRAGNCKLIEERSDIYNDMLQNVFTQSTGLYTQFFTNISNTHR